MIRPLLVTILVSGVSCSSNHSDIITIQKAERHQHSKNVEYVRLDVHSADRSIGYLHAVYASPKDVQIKLGLNDARKSVEQTFPSALVVANAGFFTEAWKPTGLLRHSGRSLSPLVSKGGPAGSGILLMTDNKLQLMEREKVTRAQIQKATFAIQAGPRIIEPNGKPGIRSNDGKYRNRTLIGISDKGLIVIASFVAHTSNGRGVSLFQLQELFTTKIRSVEGMTDYALKSALNLDGGPSTSFIFRDSQRPIEVAPGNKVLSVIALEAK